MRVNLCHVVDNILVGRTSIEYISIVLLAQHIFLFEKHSEASRARLTFLGLPLSLLDLLTLQSLEPTRFLHGTGVCLFLFHDIGLVHFLFQVSYNIAIKLVLPVACRLIEGVVR